MSFDDERYIHETFTEDKLAEATYWANMPKHQRCLAMEYERELLKRDYIVKDLLEVGRVHMLIGTSGVGKSTLLFHDILYPMTQGLPILGHESKLTPFVYYACDRSRQSILEFLDRLDLLRWAKENVEIWSIENMRKIYGKKVDALQLIQLPKYFPWAKLHVVESIHTFFGQIKNGDYTETMKFWNDVRCEFLDQGKTILATSHPSKSKIDVHKLSIREMVHGSVGHGGSLDTVMLLERDDPRSIDEQERSLHISYRNYRPRQFTYSIDSKGLLVYQKEILKDSDKESIEETSMVCTEMDKFLEHSDILELDVIKAHANDLHLGKTTIYRWIKQRESDGQLQKIGGPRSGRWIVSRKVVQ